MAYSDKLSRLSRLTSILLKLQAKSCISVVRLSEEFQVSPRTIYRDILSLGQSGVPVVSVEGKGYALMEGYTIPPVMLTESEANALIIAEKMISKTKDESLIVEFNKAIDKIKSVLRSTEKQKSNFLLERTIIGKNWDNTYTSSYLSDLQKALTNFSLIKIAYKKEQELTTTIRTVEPFAIYHNTSENWVLIAWCRLRNDFRTFRVDRISRLEVLQDKFSPHRISLDDYIETQRKKYSKDH